MIHKKEQTGHMAIMYMIFNWKVWVTVAAWIALVMWMAISYVHEPSGLFDLRPVVVVTQGLLLLLLWNPIWRRLWQQFPLLGKLIFPDLNGEWDVRFQTNWPVIEKLMQSARREIPKFDVLEDPKPDLEQIKLRAKIYQSWSTMRVELYGTEGSSEELIVVPRRALEGARHCLFCVFRQTNRVHSATDTASFLGACTLEIDEIGREMEGNYWTNRMWHRGLNTAGLVTFSKAVSVHSH